MEERDVSSIPVRPAGTTGPTSAGKARTAATHMGHSHMRAAAGPMTATAAPVTTTATVTAAAATACQRIR